MALLKGFPPSNTIAPMTRIPDLEGESIVIDVRDPFKRGRVMLSFGSWAEMGGGNGELPIPSCGTKVRWTAFSTGKKFWYHWDEKWKNGKLNS